MWENWMNPIAAKSSVWHDLRKNPDDVPDVPHPESTWFEVVQAKTPTGRAKQ